MPTAAVRNGLTSLRRFWRLDINASDNALEKSIEENDRRESVCARALIFGLLIEVVFAFWFRDGKTFIRTWSPVFADILVAGGVLGEVHFASKIGLAGGELRRRSTDRLAEATKLAGEANERAAEANERAEKAGLAHAELVARLAPRSLSASQRDALLTLRDKLPAVNIATESNPETKWFAMQIAHALIEVGVQVNLFDRSAGTEGIGNILCDHRAFFDASGLPPTQGEPLATALTAAGIPFSLLAGLPADLRHAPWHVPMLIIGGRWPVPPNPPYFGVAPAS